MEVLKIVVEVCCYLGVAGLFFCLLFTIFKNNKPKLEAIFEWLSFVCLGLSYLGIIISAFVSKLIGLE